MSTTTSSARRDRQRQATLDEIITASRQLISEGAGLSLRSVAQRMGLTAPALYRYVASYQDLLRAVAVGIDQAMTREWLEPACAAHPADDPAARITAAALAFRAWALAHREEFGIVFANTDVEAICADPSLKSELPSGHLFTELLGQIWLKYQFPVPSLDDMDPALVEILRDPQMPLETSGIPDELRGMVWIFIRSWAALYGTVTLEVFGHLDPRIIESGAMFRQMFIDQSHLLGLTEELPRLRGLIDEGLAGGS